MEKLKKMTHSLKRDFTPPKKIPIGNESSAVRLLGVRRDKNDVAHSRSLDEDEEDIAHSSDSFPNQENSTKKSDIVENEGKHFFKKLAVNLSLTKKGKELKSKTKVFPASISISSGQHDRDEEQGDVVTEEETCVSESDSLDYIPDALDLSEDEGSDIDIILSSLTNSSCYDIIQPNTKLVILDNKLTLKKALHSMMETGVRACPLWDSDKQSYVGMLTITDFIRILQQYYEGPNVPMKVFTEPLKDWQDIIHSRKEFLHLTLQSRLIDACRILLENRIRRLPVVDSNTGTIFSILNQKPILKFIYNVLKQKSVKVRSLDISIREAGLGSFQNIAVANNETKVIEILNKFLEEGVTALPIVDSEGKLTNIYSKFDVFSLESFFDLEIPVSEASKHKIYFEGVYNCKGTDSVFSVLETLVVRDVSRLVIVDGEERVEGVVTVSDLIDYVVLRHVVDTTAGERLASSRHSSHSSLSSPPPASWLVT